MLPLLQFSLRPALRNPRPWRQDRKSEERLSFVKKDHIRDHISKLDTHKSMGPDAIHSQVLKELGDVIAKPLSIKFKRSWSIEEL